jgi:hypothetical protein
VIDWQKQLIGPTVSVFGQPAVYAQAGQSYGLNGMFHEAYSTVDVSSGMPVTTTSPAFGFNVADLPVVARQKDRLTITANGRSYIVRNTQPDGLGWCWLLLNAAPVFPDIPVSPVQDA